ALARAADPARGPGDGGGAAAGFRCAAGALWAAARRQADAIRGTDGSRRAQQAAAQPGARARGARGAAAVAALAGGGICPDLRGAQRDGRADRLLLALPNRARCGGRPTTARAWWGGGPRGAGRRPGGGTRDLW